MFRLVNIALVSCAVAQAPPYPPILAPHPRLVFGAEDVPSMRARSGIMPYSAMLRVMADPPDPAVPGDWYTFSTCARNNASLYTLTGDASHCAAAATVVDAVVNASGLWSNTSATGLTRAYVTVSVVLAYDQCAGVWPAAYTASLSQSILINGVTIYETFDPVDGLGNNHEGVRYASAGLSFLACDDAVNCPVRAGNAYDALMGHLRANLGQQSLDALGRGWNPEGMGYTAYPWEFIGPFVIASRRLLQRDVALDVPPAALSLWTTYLSAIPIPHIAGSGALNRGLHADFQDDNPVVTLEGTMGLGFAVCPATLLPAMRYMYDTYWGDGTDADGSYDGHRGGALYSYVFYPFNVSAAPPNAALSGYNDTAYGMALWRKSFASPASVGENDVIVQHSAKIRACFQCHSAADANGVRLLGEGSAWLTGSGRTGDPRGQTTLFPVSDPVNTTVGTPATGMFVQQPVFWYNGSSLRGGYSVGAGSSTNVSSHVRRVVVDFANPAGASASAVMLMADTSGNALTWRANSPGFNTLRLPGRMDAFTAAWESPRGSSLLVYVLFPPTGGFNVRNGTFARDNPSDPHSIGYPYYNGTYLNNTFIDVVLPAPGTDVLVAMLLLPSGVPAPATAPVLLPGGSGCCMSRRVRIGSVSYSINGTVVTTSD